MFIFTLKNQQKIKIVIVSVKYSPIKGNIIGFVGVSNVGYMSTNAPSSHTASGLSFIMVIVVL